MTTGSIISSFKEEESKRSPYFQSPRPLLSSTDTPKSSVFFSRSPSSVHGSVDSLGPLIYTWINTNNSKSDFVGGPSCTRTNEACTSCPALISQAKRQFSMCPIFQQRQQQGPSSPGEFVSAQSPRNDIKNPQQRRCCVELAGETMELNVRHLCEFGCYLRAFSPCRDWVALRKTLHTRTDQSLDCMLHNWTCQLVFIEPEKDKESGELEEITQLIDDKVDCATSTPRKRRRSTPTPHLPRTVFYSRLDGKRYLNTSQVMRRLGFFRDEDEGKIFSENNKAACYKSMLHSRQNPPTTTRHRRLCFSPRQHQQQQQATGKHATSDLPCNFNLAASPLGLLEELFADNPWRLLLSTILLNRTRRIQVDTIMYMFLTLWPTPEATIEADLNEMTHRIAPLGIKHRRAMGIVQFSKDFLRLVEEKTVQNNSKRHEPEQRTAFIPSVATKRERVMFELTRSDIMNLYHCGEYAADAYQIFIQRDWQIIQPRDHALLAYVEWKRSSAQAAGSRVE